MAGIDAIGGLGGALRLGGIGGASGAAGATGGIDTLGGVGSTGGTGAADANPAGSFLDSLADAMGDLNTQITGADTAMADFAAGGSADLHTVMLELQQASIGLQAGVAVRDRLLEAYTEVMRLQI